MIDATSCSVAFFFIMSGFALGINHKVVLLKEFKFGQFLRARLSKLYPLHLLLTLAMITFVGVKWQLLPNLLLLQSWFPDQATWFSYNGQSWFVSSLVFCYLFYSIISFLSQRTKPLTCYIILALTATLVATLYWIVPEDMHTWQFYIAPPVRLIDFALGVILARTYEDCLHHVADISTRRASTVALSALILVAAVLSWPRTSSLERDLFLSTVWYVPLTFLIISLSIAETKDSPVTRILSWKPLLWLGSISFEIYMLQSIVSNIVLKLGIITTGEKFNDEVHILLILAIAIPLAWLTKRYFTTPISRWLKH